MVAGKVRISFGPGPKEARVLRMVYQGEDISETGLDNEVGQEIKGVTIVIGTRWTKWLASDVWAFGVMHAAPSFGR